MDEFQELRARNDLNESVNESETQEILRWIKRALRRQVDVRNVMNFLEVVTLATRYENQLNKNPRFSFFKEAHQNTTLKTHPTPTPIYPNLTASSPKPPLEIVSKNPKKQPITTRRLNP